MKEDVINDFNKNMQCRWKPITGYEGLYAVSDRGDVKSLDRENRTGRSYSIHHVEERLLCQLTDKDGYKVVSLSKNGTKKTIRVHRLVASAFIDNTCNYPIVNHKNEDKSDNRAWNLEWCTTMYNNHYGNGYCDKRFANISKSIRQLDLNKKLIRIYKSISEAANAVGINRNVIASRVNSNNTKPYKGYIWVLAQNVSKEVKI